MTRFMRPGKHSFDYHDLSKVAIQRALRDAAVSYKEVEIAYCGYVTGDATAGQRAVYTVGLSGIPIINVNNNCSTGSTALYQCYQTIATSQADCALALGFEKMQRGSLVANFTDRSNPMDEFVLLNHELRGTAKGPLMPQLFGNAGREHMEKYGSKPHHFAKIAEKNHRHSANNPYSQFRDVYSLEAVEKSPMIYEPLTKLQCCPTSDGAGAAIIASEDFVIKHGLEAQAVEIVGMSLKTDFISTFENRSSIDLIGGKMASATA